MKGCLLHRNFKALSQIFWKNTPKNDFFKLQTSYFNKKCVLNMEYFGKKRNKIYCITHTDLWGFWLFTCCFNWKDKHYMYQISLKAVSSTKEMKHKQVFEVCPFPALRELLVFFCAFLDFLMTQRHTSTQWHIHLTHSIFQEIFNMAKMLWKIYQTATNENSPLLQLILVGSCIQM